MRVPRLRSLAIKEVWHHGRFDGSPLGENPGRQMPPKHPCRRCHQAPARRLRSLTPSFMRPARRPQAAPPLKRSPTRALIVRANSGSSARATCADLLRPKHCRQRTRDCARSPHPSGQGWPSTPASSPPSGWEPARRPVESQLSYRSMMSLHQEAL